MARTPDELDDADLAFLTERHLGTLSTVGRNGRPHVVAIAFAYDPEDRMVRIISSAGTQKAVNAARGGWAAVCQVDGPRWLTLEGPAVVTDQADRVARAVSAFEARYRPARENPRRVAIEIDVERVLGRSG